ncbi:MAG: type I glyceraldehyde-3-phosphate dehydrogenase [bacterium]
MSIKIAINGFGRIGRAAFKVILAGSGAEVVAINDLTDNETLAHLLKYDTVYGVYDKEVKALKDGISVSGKKYKILTEKDPANLPWEKPGIDVVLECTGFFTAYEDAQKHISAGARKVIISAPSKSKEINTYVKGVNDNKIKKNEKIISNASCTTNCIAPVMKVLEDNFGVDKAIMTAVHAYTADQNLVDGPHRGGDLRRARAATENIVPTTTGAAITVTKIIPSLLDKFDGLAVRVPVPVGSLSDITALLKKDVTAEIVNNVFKKAAAKSEFKNILMATEDQIVSSDIVGNHYSAIVDLSLTEVVAGNMVKVIAWYDNEWGYANRIVELAIKVGKI